MKSYTILHVKFYLGCTIPVKFDIYLWFKLFWYKVFVHSKTINYSISGWIPWTHIHIGI